MLKIYNSLPVTQHFLKALLITALSLLLSSCSAEETTQVAKTSSNNVPIIETIKPITLYTETNLTVVINATDSDQDDLQFTLTDQPDFMHYTDEGNGTLILYFHPLQGDEGNYTSTLLKVSDSTITIDVPLTISVEINNTTTQVCDFFVDPANGDINANGSELDPWSTFEAVTTAHKLFLEGETICLFNGNHGAPSLNNYHFSTPITFIAKDGHTPSVSKLSFINSDHINIKTVVIDGSQVTPSSNPSSKAFLLNSDSNSHHLLFDNITVKSADDSSGWTKSDWYAKVYSGAWMRGEYIAITNSLFLNTYHAVMLSGDHAYMAHTVIDNFAGDAIRGLGSFSTYEYNTVRDCYIDDYAIQHDDAFQTFDTSADPKVEAVTIRFNKFLLFQDPITQFVQDNNLIGTLMQGLIITDGYADGWIVENNLIVNDQLHGISLYGVRNSRIQNNTVIQHPYFTDSDVPRIYLDKSSKTGQLNFNNIVRNNIAAQYTTWTYDETTLVEGNTLIDRTDRTSYEACFSDYDSQDFHLKVDASAIDAGVNSDLNDKDLDGNSRINGAQVDSGAYEYE